MVTGANSGIGKATATELARRGMRIVAVCRDAATGQAAAEEIKRESGSIAVEFLTADLSSMAQVRQLAQDYQRAHDRLNVLINNAGVIRTDYTRTVDGYEMTFAVNQLAPFLLTNLLFDSLKAGAPSRVINLMGASGAVDFSDLMGEKHYDSNKAYQQSKTANRLLTLELAKRLAGTGVTANGADPGFVATNLGRDTRGAFRAFLIAARPTMRSAEQGAAPSIHAASAPELETVSGRIFADARDTRGKPASHGADDDAQAKRLWDVCAELTGLAS
jgi:NAD(P)-dependent dehydrogenase (short-subunit alcohol dehydrogenase family)